MWLDRRLHTLNGCDNAYCMAVRKMPRVKSMSIVILAVLFASKIDKSGLFRSRFSSRQLGRTQSTIVQSR